MLVVSHTLQAGVLRHAVPFALRSEPRRSRVTEDRDIDPVQLAVEVDLQAGIQFPAVPAGGLLQTFLVIPHRGIDKFRPIRLNPAIECR